MFFVDCVFATVLVRPGHPFWILFLSSVIAYGKRKLYTRGNGKVGQDISHLLKDIAIPDVKDVIVRGEFIIKRNVFESKYKDTFANPRNLVAGIINRKSKDSKSKDVDFIAYEVIEPVQKPSSQMASIESMGFKTVKNENKKTVSNNYLSDVLMDWRTNYEYEIDGIIVSDDNVHPRVEGNPDHSFAFKMVMSDQVTEAKVVDVLWKPSKDGESLFVTTNSGRIYRVDNLLTTQFDTISLPTNNQIAANLTTTEISQGMGLSSSRTVTSIAIDPENPNRMVATAGNYGNTNYVYISENAMDASPTWTSIQGNLKNRLLLKVSEYRKQNILLQKNQQFCTSFCPSPKIQQTLKLNYCS